MTSRKLENVGSQERGRRRLDDPGSHREAFAKVGKPIRGFDGLFLHKREKARLTWLRLHQMACPNHLKIDNMNSS